MNRIYALLLSTVTLAMTAVWIPCAMAEEKTSMESAEEALSIPLLSVTQSPIKAPSENPHDYVTLSTYAWPNPETKNGKPYIIHDGRTNPETEKYPDRKNLALLISSVGKLAKGYGDTHDEKYARKALDLLNAWFLTPTTAMNPNLDYAQIIPGKDNDRGNISGIIETAHFTELTGSIMKIESSAYASDDFKRGIRKWFTAYLNWLQTSSNGRNAAEHFRNNQITWMTAQKVAIAEFIGNNTLAKNILQDFIGNKLPAQIEADGSQPQELKRTKSFNYSLVNLNGLFNLAQWAEHVGIDLWHYKLKNGAGLEEAMDFLVPYATGRKPWPYQEIGPYDTNSMRSLLKRAAIAYPEKREVYERAIPNLKSF